MKIHPSHFRVSPGHSVQLKKWPTDIKPLYKSEKHYKELLQEDVETLDGLQQLLYASSTYSVLLIFQAMDAAGKDGAIGHVLTGINPLGCEVHGFKPPSLEESQHDFLWRTTCRLPPRGKIGVFNRSYYEEVLVVKVHPEILQAQPLPVELLNDKKIWEGRYQSITDFERHMRRNGTRVIKFYLHLSKSEQRKRLLSRIDDPDKNWKFSLADLKERGDWREYTRAYEECLGATSTHSSPWYVVPADDKLNARLIVSRIVISSLKGLGLAYPEVSRSRRRELVAIARQLKR